MNGDSTDTSLTLGPGGQPSTAYNFALPNPSVDLQYTPQQQIIQNALTAPPTTQQPLPSATVEPAATPHQPSLSQYSQAEIAGATARGMIGQNGLPTFAPGTVQFNSRGQPYNPNRVGAGGTTHQLTLPASAAGQDDGTAYQLNAQEEAYYNKFIAPSGDMTRQQYAQYLAHANAGNVAAAQAAGHPEDAAGLTPVASPSTVAQPPPVQPTTAQPAAPAPSPTSNQLTSPQPPGPLVSHLQLTPPQQPADLQYRPQQQPPAGRQPTEVGQQTDPDATQYVKGTNIPISVAKQLIRGYEPGPQGYRAAWGMKGGLPENVETDETGFPTTAAYPGAPIGGAYGGAYPAGTMSHAAGMYQIEPGTWKTAVAGLAKEGVTIKDFSPQSQEQVASWLLRNQGMDPWAGVGSGGVPYNANLKSAWEVYQKSGVLPSDLSSPGDYAGFRGGGPIYAGDTSGGYGVGGALAFAPRGPAVPSGTAGGGPAQSSEANPHAAGGPGGAPKAALTPAEIAFQNMTKQQQQGRGYQMLALLAAMGRGHIVQSGYNPAAAIPHLNVHELPIGPTGGYSPVPSVQTPGVQTLRRSYST